MNKDIAVVIVNYNGYDFTIKCIQSVLLSKNISFEIILVDNGSTESEKGKLISFIKIHFKNYLIINNLDLHKNPYKNNSIILIDLPSNVGFCKANNIAIQYAYLKQYNFVFLLNNDAIIEPNSLYEMYQIINANPQIASIQPKVLFLSNPSIINSVGTLYSVNGLAFNRGEGMPAYLYNTTEEIFGTYGAATLYRVKALYEVAINSEIFDENFFAYTEETELALRLRYAGWLSWYCPNAVVYHHCGGTTKKMGKKIGLYYRSRNQIWILLKIFPLKFLLKNLPFIFLAELLQIAKNILYGNFIIIKAKLDAIWNIKTMLKKRRLVKRQIPISQLEKWLILRWY